ncbi:hypothetical protein ACFZCL_10330 [Streptomyces sp. NPDC008159]|uniref:hypothetical protein n=1 Tax=Streptomyces sp. NPDC008159 TaxID=3364817 RepID=UPI0036E6BA94
MTGVQWQYRDEGSGGPGHLQAVLPSGSYALYRAFMDHSLHCDSCEYGEVRCATANRLWARYAGVRDSTVPAPCTPVRPAPQA